MSTPAPAWPRWLLWCCVALGSLVLLAALVLLPLTVVGALKARRHRGPYRTVAEARYNLKGLYTSEKSFYDEHDRYSPDLREIGFEPERTNRYAYFIAASGVMQDRSTREPPSLAPHQAIGVDLERWGDKPAMAVSFAQLPALAGGPVGVTGTCPDCRFLAVATGNIDDDPALDIWTIASYERTGPKGERIGPGEPFNDYNDVEETQPLPPASP